MSEQDAEIIRKLLYPDTEPYPRLPLVVWNDLRLSRTRIDFEALGAAHRLLHEDLPLLILSLSDRKWSDVSVVMQFLSQFWNNDISIKWMYASRVPHMQACGMHVHLHWLSYAAQSEEDSENSLNELQDVLKRTSVSQCAQLWWQAISIAGRYGRVSADDVLTRMLYNVAARVSAEESYLPEEELLNKFHRTNSNCLAILPYIAFFARSAGSTAFSDIAESTFSKRLIADIRSEESSISLTTMNDKMLLDACSLAVASISKLEWWAKLVEEVLCANAVWVRLPSAQNVWKATWLMSAAALAIIRLDNSQTQRRNDLLAMLGEAAERHRTLLFWEPLSGHHEERLFFARVLGRVFTLDANHGAWRIIGIASEMRSPDMICEFLRAGGAVVPTSQLKTLVKDFYKRHEFYAALRS